VTFTTTFFVLAVAAVFSILSKTLLLAFLHHYQLTLFLKYHLSLIITSLVVTLAPIAKINKMNGPFSPLICLRRVNPQSGLPKLKLCGLLGRVDRILVLYNLYQQTN